MVGIVGFALGGCDGWPTTMSNRGGAPISFAYWHEDYDRPSATFRLEDGRSMNLAREHRLRDFKEIRITEKGREFTVSGEVLQRLQGDCRAYNCVLVYAGDGRLSARHVTKADAEEGRTSEWKRQAVFEP